MIYSGVEHQVTMSMGVSVAETDAKTDVETLLKCADSGLYAAKAKGRNRVERFAEAAESASLPRAR